MNLLINKKMIHQLVLKRDLIGQNKNIREDSEFTAEILWSKVHSI